jgi:hypothetical protein
LEYEICIGLENWSDNASKFPANPVEDFHALIGKTDRARGDGPLL